MTEVRLLEMTEIPAAMELVWEVFIRFEAPEYLPEGVQTFCQFIEANTFAGTVQRGEAVIYGAFLDGELAGVAATRGTVSHISLLFVREKFHRRGVATALMERLEGEARKSGAEKMTVNSSPYAGEVYRRWGFVPTGPQQVSDGITFTPMVKML